MCRGRPSLGTQSGGGHLPGIWDILLGLCPLTGRSLSAEGRPLAWLGTSCLCVWAAFLRTFPVSTLGAPGLPGRKRLAPGPGGSLEFGASALKCQAYVLFLVFGAELLSSAIPGEEPGPRFSVPSGYGYEMYTKCFSYLPYLLFFGGSF